MHNSVHCPLCKIPVVIHKGMRKDLKSTHHVTRKSQVYCPKCGKTLKEAYLANSQQALSAKIEDKE